MEIVFAVITMSLQVLPMEFGSCGRGGDIKGQETFGKSCDKGSRVLIVMIGNENIFSSEQ